MISSSSVLRDLAAHGRQWAAATFGRQAKWRRKGGLVILTYHRVLPIDHPDRKYEQAGMIVSPQLLERHVQWLRNSGFQPIGLQHWVSNRQERSNSTKFVAFTFDDGWRDNFDYAWPILRKYQVPATIFVVTDLIGSSKDMWPGRLARLIDFVRVAGSPEKRMRFSSSLGGLALGTDIALRECAEQAVVHAKKHYSDAEIIGVIDEMEADLGIAEQENIRRFVSWSEIRDMLASNLVDIGSHTKTHKRLSSSISKTEMKSEISDSARVISEKTGVGASMFCYPNGDVGQAAEREVREVYAAACTTSKGWNDTDSDLYGLRRISIHEDATSSPGAFAAKLSGWY